MSATKDAATFVRRLKKKCREDWQTARRELLDANPDLDSATLKFWLSIFEAGYAAGAAEMFRKIGSLQ